MPIPGSPLPAANGMRCSILLRCAAGICGSGIIEAIAELFKAG
ncbi:MAG: hypothetical protein R2867_01170 [Caldilineaceae bacterium]